MRSRNLHRGLVGALLLSTSTVGIHAQERDVQRELDAQKAQINALTAAIKSLKVSLKERRQEPRRTRDVARQSDLPSAPPAGPAGYTSGGFQPIGGFDDKKLHFGGITITPGGYVAAEGIYRTRSTGADVATPFGSFAFPNSPLAHTDETRFSIKQTRAALLVEGNVSPSILGAGYVEADLNGAATTTNFTQTNGFTTRLRHAYITMDFLDTGFHVLAGQAYSLITTNSKGITPRNEVLPPGPENNDISGNFYGRNPQIRLVKDFDKKLWFAVSAEASSTNISGCGGTAPSTVAAGTVVTGGIPGNGVAQVTCLENAAALDTGNIVQTTSLQHIPDIFGKVAYEARIADRDVHFEGVGAYRNFYDRTNAGTALAGGGFTGASSNKNTNGFGVGGSIVATVIPTKLDFIAQGMIGRGIGRYSSSGLADATIGGNGSLTPLRSIGGWSALIFHPTPQLDLYFMGGIDKVYASYASNGAGGFIGYGAPNLNNNGCYVEGGTCAGQTGSALNLSAGFWDKIYQGRFGYVRAGLQYEHIKRTLLPGLGGVAPSTDENVVFTSLRYFPFQ